MEKSKRVSFQEWISKSTLSRLSLRGKLTAANMAIATAIILVMGTYVFIRIRDGSRQLILGVEEDAKAHAEEDYLRLNFEEAAKLGNFFQEMTKNTGIAADSISALLDENQLADGSDWDAGTALEQLPNGSWDNSNSDKVAIFIPTGAGLNDSLIRKINLLKYSELFLPSILDENPDIVAIYFGGEKKETVYFPNIDLAKIVPADFDVTGRQWYVAAAPGNNPDRHVVWSAPYEDAALNGLVITTSIPVFDSSNRFQGVVAMDIQITRVIGLVSGIQVEETGYAFLVDHDGRIISLPERGFADFGITDETAKLSEIMDPNALPSTPQVFKDFLNKVIAEGSGVFNITLGEAEHTVAFSEIPEIGYKIIYIAPSTEITPVQIDLSEQIASEARNTIVFTALLVGLVLFVASIFSFAISNTITAPIRSLAEAASELTKGNLNARAEVQTGDEMETLADSFNRMSDTVKDLVISLEQRVRERTVELQRETDRGRRQSKQYEAVARVAQDITLQKNLSALLPQVAEVISEQFGFYHVGIFLNDSLKQYAVLVAANSEGGKRMLNRGHQLRIGAQGIVGYVTDTMKPRIALNVGEDSIYFDNPDLPETKSEMALPLIEAGEILGALDVQSREPNAFSNEDLESLTILAELVSIAIHNAKLYEQQQRSLAEAEAVSQRFLRENWNRLAEEFKLSGYRYTAGGVSPLPLEEGNGQHSEESDRKQVTVPIIVRGQALGELIVSMPKDESFKSDQMDTIRAVADRVAVIAENARLFDETQRRAERERLVSDITTKIRGSNDPQEMIETAIQELRQALKVSRIEIVPQKSKSPDR